MNAALVFFATISIFRMGGEIELSDVPNGAVLRTMGGDIRIAHGAGKIVAKTMGGDIDILRLDGSADAGTMGGDIRVTVTGSGRGHDLELRSLGGEIELTLPRDFDGDFTVELEDDHEDGIHRITSDFPLNVHESTRWSLFHGTHKILSATGRSGAATNHVKVTTIGSNITIRRR